ncbi:MAG TPA: YceI family protein [Kofleriaceae bacterium]|nr:YceI family protein [Kofleriaceae bacterium]
MRPRLAPSPLWALVPVAAAAALAALRWHLQGSGNLYTQIAKRLYVPDPDLGWRLVEDGPPWLGLDAVAALVAVGAGLLAAWLVLRRLERGRGVMAWPRRVLFAIGALSPAVPVWALASGLGPSGARESLPAGASAAPPEGIAGALEGLPAGSYRALDHEGAVVSATLRAGGEVFEARFSGVRGQFRGDPGDLAQPMSGWVEVAASSIDTGIDLRNQHAREDLEVERHPAIRFELGRLTAARPSSPREITFRAEGQVTVMGQAQPVELTGTLASLDGAGRARLGLGEAPAMVARVTFSIRLDRTPIGDNEGTFTETEVPVVATLLFQQGSEER